MASVTKERALEVVQCCSAAVLLVPIRTRVLNSVWLFLHSHACDSGRGVDREHGGRVAGVGCGLFGGRMGLAAWGRLCGCGGVAAACGAGQNT